MLTLTVFDGILTTSINVNCLTRLHCHYAHDSLHN